MYTKSIIVYTVIFVPKLGSWFDDVLCDRSGHRDTSPWFMQGRSWRLLASILLADGRRTYLVYCKCCITYANAQLMPYLVEFLRQAETVDDRQTIRCLWENHVRYFLSHPHIVCTLSPPNFVHGVSVTVQTIFYTATTNICLLLYDQIILFL